jgi:hypothetical protein
MPTTSHKLPPAIHAHQFAFVKRIHPKGLFPGEDRSTHPPALPFGVAQILKRTGRRLLHCSFVKGTCSLCKVSGLIRLQATVEKVGDRRGACLEHTKE